MEIMDAVTQVLIDKFFTSLMDVIKNMNDDFKEVDLLKLSWLHGWQLIDRALGYQLHCSPNNEEIVRVKDVTIFLIQLLYDVEDMLDRHNPNVLCQKRNVIARFHMAVLQCLGLSKKNARQLVDKLDEILLRLKDIFHQWDSTPNSGMDLGERKCLAYFLLFPIDYQFKTDDLVHLWIGEDFVQPNDNKSFKQSGEVFVKNLLAKSILQPLEDSKLSYKFDNSRQDFAKSVAAGTCLHLDQYRSSIDDNTRHLSLSCDFNSGSWSRLRTPKLKLRTLLSLYTKDNQGHLEGILLKLENSLKVLRVLSLRYTTLQNLPPFIGKLKHLRYLDISFTLVKKLPSKLHKKYPALQFLKINQSRLSTFPPEKFHQLTNLRYVDWEEDFLRGTKVPGHIGYLTHLENLPLFQVGTKDGYFISELEGMDNLQGSICIENLECVYAKPVDADRNAAEEKAFQAAKKAMLHKKCGLKRIALHWKRPYLIRDCTCDEHILKGLRPDDYVKELKIENYGGDNLPEWTRKSMIEKVSLLECRDCYLPALGRMENLTTLVLEDMRHITEVRCFSDDDDADTGGCFPQLESMEFHNMTDLVQWTGLEAPNVLPCLKELKFVGCTRIHDALHFIRYLIESKPTIYISNDDECLRCNGDGTCNSSVACPHN